MTVVWQHVAAATERVVVGAGSRSRLGELCDAQGMSRVVVVTGRTLHDQTPVIRDVEALLGTRHAATFAGMREHVPATAAAALLEELRSHAADGVVSVGGGSPIDGAKVALHAYDAGATPHLAMPTTLSAAELTPMAGVTDDSTLIKSGVAGNRLTPRVVILDPEITVHTPARLWLSTGIRALDHATETVYAPEDDRFASFLAVESIRRLRRWLPVSKADDSDIAAREQLQIAAWWSVQGLPGVTVAPSHALGRLLGPLAGVGHGITSCVLLPASIDYTAHIAPDRVARLTGAYAVTDVFGVAAACRELIADLGLPTSLREAGVGVDARDRLISLIPDEWKGIVNAAW
jgi:maleylacetate reductase